MTEVNIDELRATSIPDLIQRMTAYSTGTTGAELDAQRQTIKAIIDEKLTATLTQAIDKLNRSTTRLTIVGWVLSIIGVIAGIIVIVPLYLKK